jgi:hypothetical protein
MVAPMVFSLTLQDFNGQKTTTRAYYEPTDRAVNTVDEVIADWTTFGTDMNAATNAEIKGGSITIRLAQNGAWKSAAVDENDDADILTVNYGNAVTLTKYGILIPAYLEAFVTNGVVVPTTPLNTLTAFLLDGAANGDFTNPAGQDLTAVADYFLTDRSNVRRALKRRSKSVT